MPTSSTLSFPNTLTNNTPADAPEVMANFAAVATLLNSTKLGTNNIKDATITTELMEDDCVDKTKINANIVDGTTIEQAGDGSLRLKDKGVSLAKLADAIAKALVPTGSVLAYAGTSAPDGYLMCDGSAVSRTTYSTLFAIIGVSHGQGDNVTTFNLPDYRGRFLRGVDGGQGRDLDAAGRTAMNTGGNTGDAVGTLQADELKSHRHTESGAVFSFDSDGAGTGLNAAKDISTNTGLTGGNETRPKNASVNFLIKT